MKKINSKEAGGKGPVLEKKKKKKNQFERGGGGSELSDQLLDPDVPTLASQDKLKVSPKGLPFVINSKGEKGSILKNQ